MSAIKHISKIKVEMPKVISDVLNCVHNDFFLFFILLYCLYFTFFLKCNWWNDLHIRFRHSTIGTILTKLHQKCI